MQRNTTILVPVAPGELIDKITILQIKAERMRDPAKVQNVQRELELLLATRDAELARSDALSQLTADLKKTNERLWDIEDAIRQCEREGDFGPRFIDLARSVYIENDQRAHLKRRVNELLGSVLVEEKEYVDYAPTSGSDG